MKRRSSEAGGARGLLILLLLAALAGAIYLAGRMWLSRYEDPVEVSKRLESLLGSPVSLAAVETRPLRRQVLLKGFEMKSVGVESATLEVDPSAMLGGEWEFGAVDLYRPVWRVPARGEDFRLFIKGLLLPVSLAMRAENVTVSEGVLVAPAGAGSLATSVSARFARQNLDSPYAPVDAVLGWVLRDGEGVSAQGVYRVSELGDSVSVENLRLSAAGLLLTGVAVGSMESPVWARADVASEDFCGGALKISVDYRESSGGPAYDAHVVVTGVDGGALLRERMGMRLLSSGRLGADFRVEGRGPDLEGAEEISARGEGDVKIVDAVIDPDGPLAELIPLIQSGGGSVIESLSGHLSISYEGIVLQDMTAISSGMTWTGSGRVRRDGSLSGSLLGRIPAKAIGAEGTAVALFAAMLAGRDGRIPAAFSIGGTLKDPTVGFDVDGTADAIAASGRPQAKQLIKGLSRREKEDIARAVDDFFRGM